MLTQVSAVVRDRIKRRAVQEAAEHDAIMKVNDALSRIDRLEESQGHVMTNLAKMEGKIEVVTSLRRREDVPTGTPTME